MLPTPLQRQLTFQFCTFSSDVIDFFDDNSDTTKHLVDNGQDSLPSIIKWGTHIPDRFQT